MRGVSQFISYALVILFSITAVAVVTMVSLPTLQKSREAATFDTGLNSMQQLDSAIREVASESQGSARSVSVSGGMYSMVNGSNSLIFSFTGPISNGTNTTIGNIRITAGNMTLQYDRINLTGSFHLESGKICVENAGAISGQAIVNIRSC